MKKDQVKILATALYEASHRIATAKAGQAGSRSRDKNKQGKEVDTVITNFSAYLNQHYLVSMIPNILAELEKIHFLNEGIVSTKVTSSEELPKEELEKISDLIKTKTRQEVVVKTEIDKDLLGGAIVKYNDKIIDLSIKNQLISLAKQLSN